MPAQPNNVIRPEQFSDFADFADEDIEVLGIVPASDETPPAPAGSADPMVAVASGVSALASFFYDNRMFIRNTALVVGGVYVAVKGPPIVAKSFADTMHYLREGWHGRGYENRS